MKKLIFTIYFFLGIYSFGFCQQLNVNSDESVPPSDRYTSGYTYDWDKGYSAIADFVLNPNGKNKEAFDRLISAVKAYEGEDRKAARDHLLVLFTLVDPDNPDLIKARQALASALF